MPDLSDFLTLSLNGMELEAASWRGEILRADFGGGYGAKAVVGSYGGLHTWTLSSGCLPDDEAYGNLIEGKPRFQYYFDFFREHITGERDVFQIEYRGKQYHASVSEPTFDAEVLTYDLFAGGIEIKQRRVAGIVYNDDGSIFDISALPNIYSAHIADEFPGPGGQAWPNYLFDVSEVQPLTETAGDVVNVPNVQNGRDVVRFNNTSNDGLVGGSIVVNFLYEGYIVMKMREATFSNDAGVFTADTLIAILLGDSGTTKFTDLGIGASYEYRLNGVLYDEDDQQAPMNEFGVVHFRVDTGLTIENMQLGKDREATDRYAEIDIGEIVFIGGVAESEPLSTENSAKLTEYLMKKWGIS